MHGGMIHRPITVLHCTRTVELRGASGRSAFYWYSMNIGMEACAKYREKFCPPNTGNVLF